MTKQPDFEDERTLLTARPVVPLEQVDAKVKHRRRWVLGGAFAVAMFLGAASALLSAYFKFRNAPDPQIQPEIQALSVLPVAEASPESPVLAVVPDRPKPRPRNRDKNINAERTDTDSRDYSRLSDDEALRRVRDAVLVDQW